MSVLVPWNFEGAHKKETTTATGNDLWVIACSSSLFPFLGSLLVSRAYGTEPPGEIAIKFEVVVKTKNLLHFFRKKRWVVLTF